MTDTTRASRSAAPERGDRRGMSALGAQVSRIAGPVLRRNGTAAYRLRAEWPRIAGERMAAVSMPEKLSSGVLQLRAESTAALLIQHQERQLLERINGYLGHGTVRRLRLVQGPVARPADTPGAAPPAVVDDTELRARLESEIDDPGLRAALLGLGRALKRQRSVDE